MKARGSAQPPGAFSIDAPRGGVCLVRLYQNVHAYCEAREDGTTESGWEYDEYHVPQTWWDGLEAAVEANYGEFLRAAKEAEIDKSNAALYEAQCDTDALLVDQALSITMLELGL